MTYRSYPKLFGAVLLAAMAGGRLGAAALNVFAAASLADALQEIAPAYEAGSGDSVRFNLAGSSTLARQIKEGAPADVFFSADEAKMNDLAAAGLIVSGTRASLLSNALVIVVSRDAGATIGQPADLAGTGVRRLALAETQTVPAGIYAREYLKIIGLWDQVARKVVATENVRAALAAVESGNADAGIVYQTDAMISNRVKIACAVPLAAGPEISYPVAVVKESKNVEAARRFVAYLASSEAAAVFAKYGFLPTRQPNVLRP